MREFKQMPDWVQWLHVIIIFGLFAWAIATA